MSRKRSVSAIEQDLERYGAARNDTVALLARHERLANACPDPIHKTRVLVYRSALADLNVRLRSLESESVRAKARENNTFAPRKGY